MKTHIEELKARHAKELQELQTKEAIASILPEALPFPTISNISQSGQVRAWLSFHAPYGIDAKAFALSVFTEMEKAGAKALPLSLCQWDNYRRSVSPGLVESIPDEKKGSFGHTQKLNDIDPIAPVWVTPCQHTGTEAHCFYELAGAVYRVGVPLPNVAHLSCHRVEYHGGWRFDGPCTVHFPQSWHSIHTENGESVAHISQHTRGYRDTEQGISGNVYWLPLTEQSEFPLSPAQFVAQLLIA